MEEDTGGQEITQYLTYRHSGDSFDRFFRTAYFILEAFFFPSKEQCFHSWYCYPQVLDYQDF